MTNTTTEPVASARIIPNEYYALEGQTVCVMRMFAVALALSLKNRVLYITDDEEQYNRFKKLVVNNKEFGNDDNALLVKNGNKNYLNQKLYDNMDKFLNMNEKKKFDCCIMNPPYDKNLHLKILEKVIPVADKVVNISPIRWLQDPLAEYKNNCDWKRFENIREKIESLDVILKNDVFKLFGITNSEDLGIYNITNKGGFIDFEPKLLCKRCFDKIKNNLCNIEHNKKDGWRIRICTISNSNHRTGGMNNLGKLLIFNDGMKDGKPWYNFYQKNKWSKTTSEITYSIKFDTEEEAKNFIDVLEKTKFGKWYEAHIITDIHICNMNVLWLPDYTQPWTDKKLCEYFGITGYIDDAHAEPGSEWEIILNTMKEYE